MPKPKSKPKRQPRQKALPGMGRMTTTFGDRLESLLKRLKKFAIEELQKPTHMERSDGEWFYGPLNGTYKSRHSRQARLHYRIEAIRIATGSKSEEELHDRIVREIARTRDREHECMRYEWLYGTMAGIRLAMKGKLDWKQLQYSLHYSADMDEDYLPDDWGVSYHDDIDVELDSLDHAAWKLNVNSR